ncbi:ectoderm-neural cortex protein 1-like [Antedon mediterranea]|uniref:ectoderm-neural cortex protein 1-like n=1 Tax=Antedon mediterranea TaxID=105859 RepID=UPI003AF5A1CA
MAITADKHFEIAILPKTTLSRMNDFRRDGILIDIYIEAGQERIPGHRNVLAASSNYFYAMFTSNMKEKHDDTIHISNIDAATMLSIINYIYTGQICLSPDNVQSVFEAACLMQLTKLQKCCSEFFIHNLDASNCLGVYNLAILHDITDLANTTLNVVLQSFSDVLCEEDFLRLTKEQLTEMLKKDVIVKSENQVFEGLIKWIKYDMDTRQKHLHDLLKEIRLVHMKEKYLIKSVLQHPLIEESAQCRDVISKTMGFWNLCPDKQIEVRDSCLCYQARPYREKIFIIGGKDEDQNFQNNILSCDEIQLSKSCWKHEATLPLPLHDLDLIATALDDSIFISQHKPAIRASPSPMSSNRWIYHLKEKTWKKIQASRLKFRFEFGIAYLEGFVYIIGGYDANMRDVSKVERYNCQTDTWDEVAKLPYVTDSCVAAECNRRIIVIGGHSSSRKAETLVQSYDPSTDRWTMINPLTCTINIKDVSCLSLEGKVYVFYSNPDMHVLYYNQNNKKWQELLTCEKKQVMFSVCRYQRCIALIGGLQGDYIDVEVVGSVDIFKPNTAEWKLLPNAAIPRCAHQSVSFLLSNIS